jgi:hypothetical protein
VKYLLEKKTVKIVRFFFSPGFFGFFFSINTYQFTKDLQ